MKILYTVDEVNCENKTIDALNNLGWKLTQVDNKGQLLTYCSTRFYDVIVIDLVIKDLPGLEIVKTIRDRQIFTPILLLTRDENERTIGLADGADACVANPTTDELVLIIRALYRRNTNYQSPTIDFEGVQLNRPDGKICYDTTSLSVSPIEIEIFRLLTRASAPISIATLADKIHESEDKVSFFSKCLQKKIGLLNGSIRLEIKNSKCRLVKKH